MAGISAFRSDDVRAAYLRLYDAALAASTIPVTESDIDTSFGRTHVLRAGDPSKPPLVALHGSSISSTSWVPLLPILTATHRVTMIDAIDESGKSIATKPTTDSAGLVAWLDETLRAVDIQRSALVAVSRGTWIATPHDRLSRAGGPLGAYVSGRGRERAAPELAGSRPHNHECSAHGTARPIVP